MTRATDDAAGRGHCGEVGRVATAATEAAATATSPGTSPRRADAVRNRTSILEAARQLVTEQGTEVAMGEIARAAGVAVGTLYRHFPNKADLLAAVVNEYVEILAEDAQDAWARVEAGRADAAQELLEFLERALEMIARSHTAKVVARALGAEVDYAEPETRAIEALERLIEAGGRTGGCAPTSPSPTSTSSWSSTPVTVLLGSVGAGWSSSAQACWGTAGKTAPAVDGRVARVGP